MRAAEINRALSRIGLNQATLASKLGISQAAVSQVIGGKSRSTAIENAISGLLGIPVGQIWPEPFQLGRGITVQGAEELLITLWRRMGFDQQMLAMDRMKELADASPPDAKPGSEGIAGMRHVLTDYAKSLEGKNVTASGAGSVAAGRDISGVKIENNVGQLPAVNVNKKVK